MKVVNINYFPQDPFVSGPRQVSIEVDNLAPGPDDDRIDTSDSERPVAQPDDAGNMLYQPDDPRFNQVQAFSVVHQSLNRYERQLGRKIKWSFNKPRIIVYPDKGEMLNAYYNRYDGSLNFFHSIEKSMNKTVFTGQSTEVAVHELGHAILDALRPSYVYSWSYDTKAFHESFGDIHAILDSLHRESVLKELQEQTSQNLRKNNLVAYMAEELGRAVNLRSPNPKPDHDYIRNAVNKLTWKDPSTLPGNPEDESKLGREPHNYSRLFTGAFYDVLTGIYDENKNYGMSFYDAVKSARDTAFKLLVKTVEYAPASMSSFKQIYHAMLKADRDLNNSKFSNLIKKVFEERKITRQDDSPDIKGELPELYLSGGSVTKKSCQDFLDNNKKILQVPQEANMKVSQISSMENGSNSVQCIYNKEVKLEDLRFGKFKGACVDIPGGMCLIFDKSGKLAYKDLQLVSNEEINLSLDNISYMIGKGDILFATRDKPLSIPRDLIKKDGTFYSGYVSYKDGKMKILPSLIIN